jgi:hypothetical protein
MKRVNVKTMLGTLCVPRARPPKSIIRILTCLYKQFSGLKFHSLQIIIKGSTHV